MITRLRYIVPVALFCLFFFGGGSVSAFCADPAPGLNTTMSGSCVFSKLVTGVDSGSDNTNTAKLILGSGTLSISANQVIAVGKLELTGGSVALAAGGQVLPGALLWMIDADGDGYPATLTEYAQVSPPANGRRKGLMLSSTEIDCNESSFNATNMCCVIGTLYRDADGDGYGAPGATTTGCPTAGYVANNTDCDDTNAGVYRSVSGYIDGDGDGYGSGLLLTSCTNGTNPYSATSNDCYDSNGNAHPGSFYCGLAHRGDGSFDYNCDGKAWVCNQFEIRCAASATFCIDRTGTRYNYSGTSVVPTSRCGLTNCTCASSTVYCGNLGSWVDPCGSVGSSSGLSSCI